MVMFVYCNVCKIFADITKRHNHVTLRENVLMLRQMVAYYLHYEKIPLYLHIDRSIDYLRFSSYVHDIYLIAWQTPSKMAGLWNPTIFNIIRWVAGTNDSSTKRLMFQVLLFFHNFLQNSLQISFQFIFLFFVLSALSL